VPVADVLIVDDSPIDRRMAGRIIEKDGELRALYADDAKQALELVADNPPHIVVTDLLMPGMSGLELVAEMRTRHPLVPVVLMTAHGSEDTAVEALGAGAASYVPKRSLARELTETLQNVLSVARGAQDEQRVYALMTTASMAFDLGHDPDDLNAVVRHLEAMTRRGGLCDRAEALQVGVALREALVNAIEHGNLELDSALKEEPGAFDAARRERCALAPYNARRVSVMTDLTTDAIRWTICDDGDGFDPTELPDPTDPMNLDRVYGRGLLLIRTFMDEVQHNAAGNEITMIKRKKLGRNREGT
jgi:DNA-binding response OmpR family regulator